MNINLLDEKVAKGMAANMMFLAGAAAASGLHLQMWFNAPTWKWYVCLGDPAFIVPFCGDSPDEALRACVTDVQLGRYKRVSSEPLVDDTGKVFP